MEKRVKTLLPTFKKRRLITALKIMINFSFSECEYRIIILIYYRVRINIENEDFATLRHSSYKYVYIYISPRATVILSRKVSALIDIAFHNIFSRVTRPSSLSENCYEENAQCRPVDRCSACASDR